MEDKWLVGLISGELFNVQCHTTGVTVTPQYAPVERE